MTAAGQSHPIPAIPPLPEGSGPSAIRAALIVEEREEFDKMRAFIRGDQDALVRLDELGEVCQGHARARLVVGGRDAVRNPLVYDEDIRSTICVG